MTMTALLMCDWPRSRTAAGFTWPQTGPDTMRRKPFFLAAPAIRARAGLPLSRSRGALRMGKARAYAALPWRRAAAETYSSLTGGKSMFILLKGSITRCRWRGPPTVAPRSSTAPPIGTAPPIQTMVASCGASQTSRSARSERRTSSMRRDTTREQPFSTSSACRHTARWSAEPVRFDDDVPQADVRAPHLAVGVCAQASVLHATWVGVSDPSKILYTRRVAQPGYAWSDPLKVGNLKNGIYTHGVAAAGPKAFSVFAGRTAPDPQNKWGIIGSRVSSGVTCP